MTVYPMLPRIGSVLFRTALGVLGLVYSHAPCESVQRGGGDGRGLRNVEGLGWGAVQWLAAKHRRWNSI